MRIVRTQNTDLIRSVVCDPQVWAARAHDAAPAPEDWVPNTEPCIWLALLDGEPQTLRGMVLAMPESPLVYDMHIAILPQYWRSRDNVELGKAAIDWIFSHTPALKVVAQVPEDSPPVLRFAQRVGFKREGVNKQSAVRKGRLIDQTYLGIQKGEWA